MTQTEVRRTDDSPGAELAALCLPTVTDNTIGAELAALCLSAVHHHSNGEDPYVAMRADVLLDAVRRLAESDAFEDSVPWHYHNPSLLVDEAKRFLDRKVLALRGGENPDRRLPVLATDKCGPGVPPQFGLCRPLRPSDFQAPLDLQTMPIHRLREAAAEALSAAMHANESTAVYADRVEFRAPAETAASRIHASLYIAAVTSRTETGQAASLNPLINMPSAVDNLGGVTTFQVLVPIEFGATYADVLASLARGDFETEQSQPLCPDDLFDSIERDAMIARDAIMGDTLNRQEGGPQLVFGGPRKEAVPARSLDTAVVEVEMRETRLEVHVAPAHSKHKSALLEGGEPTAETLALQEQYGRCARILDALGEQEDGECLYVFEKAPDISHDAAPEFEGEDLSSGP